MAEATTNQTLKRKIKSIVKKCLGISSAKKWYQEISSLGKNSANSWIRRSSTIGGWLFEGEHEFLWELATREQNGDILEIGTWMGKSTCILAGACLDFAPQTKVLCIDTFFMHGTDDQMEYHRELMGKEKGTFYHFLENAIRFDFLKAVVPIAAFSCDAIPYIKANLRFAFIDGAHDYVNAKRDFELCFPLVKNGGVIAFHDVNGPAYPELAKFVEKELKESPHLKFIGSKGSIVAFEKL